MAVVCPSVCLSRTWPEVENGRVYKAENWQEGSPWQRWPVTPFRDRKIKGQGWRHVVSLKCVCPYLPYLDNYKSQKHQNLQDGCPCHGWHFRTSSKVKSSKVKVTRPLNDVTENQPYLRNGKAQELRTRHTDKVRWPASLTCALTSKVKGSWLLWNVNRKLEVAEWSLSVPMTLSDLERQDAKDQNFRVDLFHKRSYSLT